MKILIFFGCIQTNHHDFHYFNAIVLEKKKKYLKREITWVDFYCIVVGNDMVNMRTFCAIHYIFAIIFFRFLCDAG